MPSYSRLGYTCLLHGKRFRSPDLWPRLALFPDCAELGWAFLLAPLEKEGCCSWSEVGGIWFVVLWTCPILPSGLEPMGAIWCSFHLEKSSCVHNWSSFWSFVVSFLVPSMGPVNSLVRFGSGSDRSACCIYYYIWLVAEHKTCENQVCMPSLAFRLSCHSTLELLCRPPHCPLRGRMLTISRPTLMANLDKSASLCVATDVLFSRSYSTGSLFFL